jgi:hypothetical protein
VLLFSRFVSALQRHDTIEGITFVKTRFDELCGDNDDNDGDGRLDKGDLERLFGPVLPNHPTIRILRFEECVVPSRYIQVLAGGLKATRQPRAELNFRETQLDLSAIQAVAGALRRSALGKLSLHDTGMTSPKCRLLTGAAAECVGLMLLDVVEWWRSLPWIIDEEAFAPGSISKLHLEECLWFGGHGWTDGGVAELFRQLRTNQRQERISLVNLSADQTRFVVELLTTYNYTLWKINAPPPPDEWARPIGLALGYGMTARDAVRGLEPSDYQVEMRCLWPWVLEDVKTYPTLLYRFLRRGNVDAFADQVARSPLGKRRPRRSVRISQRQKHHT